MYSKLLYVMEPRSRTKQRMTFRVNPELAEALRQLPNQTAFLERVLLEALGRVCPLCNGAGEVPGVHLAVSDIKNLPIRRLDRKAAAQLKALVRVGRELLATDLRLEAAQVGRLGFRLSRENEALLTGTIPQEEPDPGLAH